MSVSTTCLLIYTLSHKNKYSIFLFSGVVVIIDHRRAHTHTHLKKRTLLKDSVRVTWKYAAAHKIKTCLKIYAEPMFMRNVYTHTKCENTRLYRKAFDYILKWWRRSIHIYTHIKIQKNARNRTINASNSFDISHGAHWQLLPIRWMFTQIASTSR